MAVIDDGDQFHSVTFLVFSAKKSMVSQKFHNFFSFQTRQCQA